MRSSMNAVVELSDCWVTFCNPFAYTSQFPEVREEAYFVRGEICGTVEIVTDQYPRYGGGNWENVYIESKMRDGDYPVWTMSLSHFQDGREDWQAYDSRIGSEPCKASPEEIEKGRQLIAQANKVREGNPGCQVILCLD